MYLVGCDAARWKWTGLVGTSQEDKEERKNPDIEILNDDLEDYKGFADMIYNRYMD